MFRRGFLVLLFAMALFTETGCSFSEQPTVRQQLFGDSETAKMSVAIDCTSKGSELVLITPTRCGRGLSVTMYRLVQIVQDVLSLNPADRCFPGGWCKVVVGCAYEGITNTAKPEQFTAVVADGEPSLTVSLAGDNTPSKGNIRPDTMYLLEHGKFTIRAPREVIESLGLTPVT